jgi:hypothetical protein
MTADRPSVLLVTRDDPELIALTEEADFVDEVATVCEAPSLEAGADRISDAFRGPLVVSGPPIPAVSS